MFAEVLPFPVMTTELDTYPNRIRELRTERGLTQAALAEQIGTSAVHVGHLELGRRELNLSMMRAIARVFDVPTSDILSRTDNPLGASPRSRQLLTYWENAEEPARQAIERVAESMSNFDHAPRESDLQQRPVKKANSATDDQEKKRASN